MQPDGNLVLHKNGSVGWGSESNDSAPCKIILQSDGNLVLYNKRSGEAVWYNIKFGSVANQLRVQNDGNIAWYNMQPYSGSMGFLNTRPSPG
jgi:hypothetical protein